MDSPKVVILCGGRGERLGELALERPKPMVEIGGRPILWHIMQHFSSHGFTQFMLALGYLGWAVDWYFKDRESFPAAWEVWRMVTGWDTQNGGRLKRLAPHLKRGTFLMSWCDGVSDLDITAMLAFHRAHGKLCTVAAVHPPERFGRLTIESPSSFLPRSPDVVDGRVVEIVEKGLGSEWINGGFFVCEPGVLDYVRGDDSQWEREPMGGLAKDGQLMAYTHTGFWQCMDTAHERRLLEQMWAGGRAPWKTWKD